MVHNTFQFAGGSRGREKLRYAGYSSFFWNLFVELPTGIAAVVVTCTVYRGILLWCFIFPSRSRRFVIFTQFIKILIDPIFLVMGLCLLLAPWRWSGLYQRHSKLVQDLGKRKSESGFAAQYENDYIFQSAIWDSFWLLFLDLLALPMFLPVLLTGYRLPRLLRKISGPPRSSSPLTSAMIVRVYVIQQCALVFFDLLFAVGGLILLVTLLRARPFVRLLARHKPTQALAASMGFMATWREIVLVELLRLGRDILCIPAALLVVGTLYRFPKWVASLFLSPKSRAAPSGAPTLTLTDLRLEMPANGFVFYLSGTGTAPAVNPKLYLTGDRFWTDLSAELGGATSFLIASFLPRRLSPTHIKLPDLNARAPGTPVSAGTVITPSRVMMKFGRSQQRMNRGALTAALSGLVSRGDAPIAVTVAESTSNVLCRFTVKPSSLLAGPELNLIDTEENRAAQAQGYDPHQPAAKAGPRPAKTGPRPANDLTAWDPADPESLSERFWIVSVLAAGRVLVNLAVLAVFALVHVFPWRALILWRSFFDSADTFKKRMALEFWRRRGAGVRYRRATMLAKLESISTQVTRTEAPASHREAVLGFDRTAHALRGVADAGLKKRSAKWASLLGPDDPLVGLTARTAEAEEDVVRAYAELTGLRARLAGGSLGPDDFLLVEPVLQARVAAAHAEALRLEGEGEQRLAEIRASLPCFGGCAHVASRPWSETRLIIVGMAVEALYDVGALLAVLLVLGTLVRVPEMFRSFRRIGDKRLAAIVQAAQLFADLFFLVLFLAVLPTCIYSAEMVSTIVFEDLLRHRSASAARWTILTYGARVLEDVWEMISFLFLWRTYRFLLVTAVWGFLTPMEVIARSLFEDPLRPEAPFRRWQLFCSFLASSVFFVFPFAYTYGALPHLTAVPARLGALLAGYFALACVAGLSGTVLWRNSATRGVRQAEHPGRSIPATSLNVLAVLTLAWDTLQLLALALLASPPLETSDAVALAARRALLLFHDEVAGAWGAVAVVVLYYLVQGAPVVCEELLEYQAKGTLAGSKVWRLATYLLSSTAFVPVVANLVRPLARSVLAGPLAFPDRPSLGHPRAVVAASLFALMFYVTVALLSGPQATEGNVRNRDVRFAPFYAFLVLLVKAVCTVVAVHCGRATGAGAAVVAALALVLCPVTLAYRRLAGTPVSLTPFPGIWRAASLAFVGLSAAFLCPVHAAFPRYAGVAAALAVCLVAAAAAMVVTARSQRSDPDLAYVRSCAELRRELLRCELSFGREGLAHDWHRDRLDWRASLTQAVRTVDANALRAGFLELERHVLWNAAPWPMLANRAALVEDRGAPRAILTRLEIVRPRARGPEGLLPDPAIPPVAIDPHPEVFLRDPVIDPSINTVGYAPIPGGMLVRVRRQGNEPLAWIMLAYLHLERDAEDISFLLQTNSSDRLLVECIVGQETVTAVSPSWEGASDEELPEEPVHVGGRRGRRRSDDHPPLRFGVPPETLAMSLPLNAMHTAKLPPRTRECPLMIRIGTSSKREVLAAVLDVEVASRSGPRSQRPEPFPRAQPTLDPKPSPVRGRGAQVSSSKPGKRAKTREDGSPASSASSASRSTKSGTSNSGGSAQESSPFVGSSKGPAKRKPSPPAPSNLHISSAESSSSSTTSKNSSKISFSGKSNQ